MVNDGAFEVIPRMFGCFGVLLYSKGGTSKFWDHWCACIEAVAREEVKNVENAKDKTRWRSMGTCYQNW